MKALGASTQRRADGGTTGSHHQAPLPRNGNRIRGGNLLHGHRHQDREDRYFPHSQGVSLAGNGFRCKGWDRTKDADKVVKVAKFAGQKKYLMDGSA